jgi:predicted kinase
MQTMDWLEMYTDAGTKSTIDAINEPIDSCTTMSHTAKTRSIMKFVIAYDRPEEVCRNRSKLHFPNYINEAVFQLLV